MEVLQTRPKILDTQIRKWTRDFGDMGLGVSHLIKNNVLLLWNGNFIDLTFDLKQDKYFLRDSYIFVAIYAQSPDF